ncbi:hypothetical protein BGX20_006528 [Mortierella sp. AD010]|nr:hypothetical protein BGX20_006528 [Mortierella sp. AD010]
MFEDDSDDDSFKDVPTLSSFNPTQPSSIQSSLHFGPSQRPADYQSQRSVSAALQALPGYQIVSPQKQTQQSPSFLTLPMASVFSFSPAPASGSPSPSPVAPIMSGPSTVLMSKRKKLDASLTMREDPSFELAKALQANEQLAAQIASLQATNKTLQAENGILRQQLDAFTSRFNDQDVMNRNPSEAIKDLQNTMAKMSQQKVVGVIQKAGSKVEGQPSSSNSPSSAVPTTPAATKVVVTAHCSYTSALNHNLSAEQLALIKEMKPTPRPFSSKTGTPRVVAATTPTVRLYFRNMQSC